MNKDINFIVINEIKESYEKKIKQLEAKLTAWEIFYQEPMEYAIDYEGLSLRDRQRDMLLELIEEKCDKSMAIEYLKLLSAYHGYGDDNQNVSVYCIDHDGYDEDDKKIIKEMYEYFGEEFCTKEELDKYGVEL